MLTLGVDAHKRVHAAVALDDAGREVGRRRAANRATGWRDLQVWAAGLEVSRRWGVEGAWGYGRGLAQHLVGAQEAVYGDREVGVGVGRGRLGCLAAVLGA
jgi:hypothetical protein